MEDEIPKVDTDTTENNVSILGDSNQEQTCNPSPVSSLKDSVPPENPTIVNETQKQQSELDFDDPPDEDFKLHWDEDEHLKLDEHSIDSETLKTEKSETKICLNLLIKEQTETDIQSKNLSNFEIAVDNNIESQSFSLDENKDSNLNSNTGTNTKETNKKENKTDKSNEVLYPEKQHRLMKPNQMIEIPMQELIDIDDSNIDDYDNIDNTTDKQTDYNSLDDNKETLTEMMDISDKENQSAVTSTSDYSGINSSKQETEKSKHTIPENDSLQTINNLNTEIDKESESTEIDLNEVFDETEKLHTTHTVSSEQAASTIENPISSPSKTEGDQPFTTIAPIATDSLIDEASNAPIATSSSAMDVPIATTSSIVNVPIATISSMVNAPIASTSSTVDAPTASATSTVDAPTATATSTVDAPTATVASTVDAPIITTTDETPITISDKQSTSPTYEVPDQDPDDVTEIDDSLGLLAESSRVMDDDEDEDDGDADRDADGDADEDDDYDPEDDQTTAEHSEDSNNLQSETDQPTVNQLIEKTPSPTDGEKFEFPTDDGSELEKEEEGVDVCECEEMDIPSPTSEGDADKIEINEQTTDNLEKLNNMSNKLDKLVTELEEIPINTQKETTTNKEISKESEAPLTSPIKEKTVQVSPSKSKVLNIAKQSNFVNYVDLEESSSEDDVQLVKQPDNNSSSDVTSINLPKDIDVMSTSVGNTSEIVTKDDEFVINVPKAQTAKTVPKLNTSELTIKTIATSEPTLVIPETKMSDVIEANQTAVPRKKTNLSLEIFSLDSDDEEIKQSAISPTPAPPSPRYKCANGLCRANVKSATLATAPVVHYFRLDKKKRPRVCDDCLLLVKERQFNMVEGVKSFKPLMDLDIEIASQELVEISDSESDDEGDTLVEEKEVVGEETAEYLEKHLADVLNETWSRYELDARLQDTQNEILEELERLETEGNELNAMFDECQAMTDKLRNELYATFEPNRKEIRPIIIVDSPGMATTIYTEAAEKHAAKRRLSSSSEPSNKRPAIPLGFNDKSSPATPDEAVKADDDEVSVVRLCAEAAPRSLPPAGPLQRAPPRRGLAVHAMRTAFGRWARAKVLDVLGKALPPFQQFTQCRVKFDNKVKNPIKVILARYLAYTEPSAVRLTIGTRVVALFKDEENGNREAFYSGVVAEVPNPVNNYRYLVFFDDGYAQYVEHFNTRIVIECSPSVWDEVHPLSREFVYNYLRQYPERPMVRLHAGQRLKVELNGKWFESPVIQVDASLVQVLFEEERRREWIYRGSTRLEPLFLELQAAERTRHRALPRAKGQNLANLPYVEYTRSEEQNKTAESQQQREQEEIRRQRAVAKKSTSTQQVPIAINNASANVNANTITSRVVYYTPKNAVKPLKMTPHNCGPRCKRSDVLSLKELRTYNPLAKPLLSGWERQIVRVRGIKEVMYRSPCGRRLRNMSELHRYLRTTRSDLPVDLFDYTPSTHCLAEFVLNKCLVGKKDLSHGRENVPVPCVNYYDTTLPEFCSYSTERTPTDGVPLNIDSEFLCGCDCTDDCQDKSKCACWKMTLEGARTIGMGSDVGYVYRRLPEPLPSGIYECNSRCKCKNTCLNRVVQHPLQLKLQVFKTLNRGWGIRSLNDVPKGSFLCIYAGNLLTDATANLDGLNEGDEYLAELDYIEVVEQMKEGYEEDVPEEDRIKDKKESKKASGSESEGEMTSSDEEQPDNENDDDDDFKPSLHEPVVMGDSVRQRSSRRRRQEKEAKPKEEETKEEKKPEKGEEDCITISDDEEVREPSRFTAQAGMDPNEFKSKYKSVRAHFGKDEACYIMDAKVQGNIGRYLNHSCSPNVFVQNVFVDTHDPRFPWVAFFALSAVKAGSELTWNYNYDVGSVPGKMLYCFCGAPNCRGRLL